MWNNILYSLYTRKQKREREKEEWKLFCHFVEDDQINTKQIQQTEKKEGKENRLINYIIIIRR